MNSNLIVRGQQEFNGVTFPIITNRFDLKKRYLADKTISEIHGVDVTAIRSLINKKITRFKSNVDIFDLKDDSLIVESEVIDSICYSKQSTIQAKNLYLLSETGYRHLLMTMKSELSWELLDKLLDGDLLV